MGMREYLPAVKAEIPLSKRLQGLFSVPVICVLPRLQIDRSA